MSLRHDQRDNERLWPRRGGGWRGLLTRMSGHRGSSRLAHSPGRVKGRARIALEVLGLMLMGLLVGACSPRTSGPGVAGASGDAATASTPAAGVGAPSGPSPKRTAELLKFSQCMQSHGISDFPDPSNGVLSIPANAGGDLDPRSPQFQAAQSACKKFMPGGNLTVRQQSTAALKYAECMRSQGLPDFPDPNGQGAIVTSGLGDLNPQSAQLQNAANACRSLEGPFKLQLGTGIPSGGGSGSGGASAG